MPVREEVIERKLCDAARRCGALPLKLVQGQGLPDRLIVWPSGRVEFVETKRPRGGALSALQVATIARLQREGFHVSVIWTAADVTAAEENWSEECRN